MRKVCLDTDFLVALLRGWKEAVKKAEEYDFTEAEISTTSINSFEIYFGAFRSKEAERNIKQAEKLLNSIKILCLNLESSKNPVKFLQNLTMKK